MYPHIRQRFNKNPYQNERHIFASSERMKSNRRGMGILPMILHGRDARATSQIAKCLGPVGVHNVPFVSDSKYARYQDEERNEPAGALRLFAPHAGASRGVTLIELLIVVAMIAILAAPLATVGIYVMRRSHTGILDSQGRNQLRLAATALIKDIKSAVAVEPELSSWKQDDQTLILRLATYEKGDPEYVVYAHKDNSLVRTALYSKASGRVPHSFVCAENLDTFEYTRVERLISFTLRVNYSWHQEKHPFEISTSVALQHVGGV
jgi:prepilin-type N-terminal cleavage/methylation domain-containing protein